MATDFQQTHMQIADRNNATKAIFNAMVHEGRHIFLENSLEFAVSQMHTTICYIRKRIKEKDRWIESGRYGKKIKEYWLEERQ